MSALANLRVATRMQLLIGLTLVGLIVLCLVSLFQLKDSMLEDRKQKTRDIVEVALGIVKHHHQLASAGKISEEDAKNAARDSLRDLRYGEDDYYFGFDTEGVYFLHGGNPKLEGQNKLDMQDTHGKYIIRELIAAAKAGGGFVDYWFPRAGQNKPEPKLGYTTLFTPWNWVVGTGIYIDDVDKEFRQVAWLLGSISTVLLATLVLFGFLVSRSILNQLGGEPKAASEIMERIANGDLTASIDQAPPGSMLNTLGGMTQALRKMVSEINSDANRLVDNAEHIATASEEVARAAEHQSDATSAMAAAIEELTVSSNHISDSARDTSQDSVAAVELSGQGSARVDQASQAIQQISETVSDASNRIHALEERAKQISSIANVIKDIAGQTNLLALNAAIEAARAGEQGRGFAVVADEVRKLAERTSLATTEIEQMIVGIQGDTVGAVEAMNAALPEVQQGVALASSASESLRAIEDGARRTLERIGEVADATKEQSSASTSIAQRVEQIANMVEETTQTIRGTASTAHQLQEIAVNLKQLISRFKV
ncbi:methyl-accepting chemotaxis protein [uncultured Azonexus sp.]|uniref:methyl-accepting chemotaxis protein n=1 Tax=uncultured Azonexus sp. TaxID=520307 RepID=UPI00260A0379|nr:methyl-accepting chemotaxis protein [uncultured Azonexus sp.]